MLRAVGLLAALSVPFAVWQGGREKTVWDGVYSAAQAARGKASYTTFCSSCHMDDLGGGGSFGMEEAPPLKREGFMEGRNLASVFNLIRDNMPPDNPSTLSSDAYLEILTYLLQQNAFPAGAEELRANPDQLKAILITSRPPG